MTTPATTPAGRLAPVLAFEVEVVGVVRLSPTFVRVTFGGSALAGFHPCGALGPRDLRIKVMIPSPGHPLPDLSDLSDGWYRSWLAMPPTVRGSMRTYTVRRACLDRPDPTLDVDFVLHLDEHGVGGPASTWAAGARPGDRVTLIGPNRHAETYAGVEWQPPAVGPDGPVRVLLAGDETAVPAICSVLETLPAGYEGHALLEVPDPADFQDLGTDASVEVSWLARGARQHGEALAAALRALMSSRRAEEGAAEGVGVALPEVDVNNEILWESPEPSSADFYAWVAGEAGTVRALRRQLVQEHGVDRRAVAFMGYWRLGRPAPL